MTPMMTSIDNDDINDGHQLMMVMRSMMTSIDDGDDINDDIN